MSHASLISRTRNSEIFIGGFDQLVPINEVMEVVLYGSYIVVVFKVLGSTRSIYMFVYKCIIHLLFMLHFKSPCTEEPRGRKRYRLNRWSIVLSSTIYNSFLHICIYMMIIHRTYIHKQLYIEPLISLSFVLVFNGSTSTYQTFCYTYKLFQTSDLKTWCEFLFFMYKHVFVSRILVIMITIDT